MSWPAKTVPEFTDEELYQALEEHEGDPDPVVRQITESCVREWERRRGING